MMWKREEHLEYNSRNEIIKLQNREILQKNIITAFRKIQQSQHTRNAESL